MIEQIVAARRCSKGHSWNAIARHLGRRKEAVRSAYRHRPGSVKVVPCPICTDGPSRDEEAPEGTTWEEHGNRAEATSTDERITSLDQLLEAAKVDLDTWQVQDWGVKKWEVGAKVEVGHLDFDSGRITGHLDKQGIGIEPLWSVWVRFIRRVPVAISPAIQPVACDWYPIPCLAPSEADCTGVQRGLLLPDPHFGYLRDVRSGKLTPLHDRQALDLAVQLASELAPDHVVVLGDLLDLAMFSDKFAARPEFYWATQPAILEAHHWLRQLRDAVPDARIDVLEGNHDARMRNALIAHLAEVYQLRAADELELPPALSPERLLALDKLRINWVGEYPDGEVWIGPLSCVHGAAISQAPGNTARLVVERTEQDTAFGHIHRVEQVSRRVKDRGGWRTVRAFSPGCLCHIDGRVPGSTAASNWQEGLGLVDYAPYTYNVSLLEIVDGVLLYGGKRWVGRDYTAELGASLPGWNW